MLETVLRSPLTWAGVLAMAYTFWLAPVSGSLGGLCFFLTVWAIPTIINILVTAWLVGFMKVNRAAKICAAIPISFFLGINLYIPRYISDLTTPRIQSTYIVHSIRYTAETPMDVRLINRLSIRTNPIEASVEVDGDEGCGCLYFDPRSPDWFEKSLGLIRDVTGRTSLSQSLYELFPSDLTPGVHFDILVEPDPRQAGRAKFTLGVFDGTRRVATFSQYGIYFDPNISQRTGRSKRLSTEWFGSNVGELLLHDNVWSRFIPQAARQFSEVDIREFLLSVLQRQASS